MKVLFVVNWYTPISENILRNGVFHYEQCMALQQYCNIRLYWPLDPIAEGLSSKVENGLFIYRSGGNLSKKIKWIKDTIKYLTEICKEYKPDIIHANVAYPAGLVCALISNKMKMPFVLTEHAPIEQMGLSNPLRKILRNWVYKCSKCNICVSKDSMERLKCFFPKREFEINYNAIIDPKTVQLDEKNYRVDGVINCAIVAAFYDKEIKGYQYLIPAIKEVNETGHDVVLHICGGGEYLEFYKGLSKSIGIDDKCIFYGQCNREKVYSIVSQMDYCVSASIFESAGMFVQEGMLLGKPILVTKSGGANSLTTEDTAIVVDRNSEKALVDGIIQMNEKYSLFDTQKIKDYARENYEISNVTKRYIKIYEKVIWDEPNK